MKKIQKGFTLVELIVVMAIMGIIMAVIFSIIGPTSRIASRVESMKDEETAAFQVSRAIKSELTYATKVYIVGVDDGAAFPTIPADMNYVYVINNSEARPNSRKSAKGMITLGTWDGSAVKDQAIVMQEPTWVEDEYRIGIDEYNTTAGNYYIDLAFRGYRMKAEGGAYVPDTDSVYNYSEAIRFVNINNRDEIKKGGNLGAANFTCEIMGDTLVPAPGKAYKDKIYIFFKPANETALSVGGGMLYTTADPSAGGGTTAGGGGTTAGGGGTTAGGGGTTGGGSTPPASLGNVTFMKSDTTTDVIPLDGYGILQGGLPSDSNSPAAEPGYKYTWVGWFKEPNPIDLNNKITSGTSFSGDTVVYPYWKKVKVFTVKFLDFENNEIHSEQVEEGYTPTGPANNPVPTEAEKVFDKWVTLAGAEMGPADADVTYRPVATSAKGLLYIHYLSKCNNGQIVINDSSDYTIDGGEKHQYYTCLSNVSKNPGDVTTIKVNAGYANVDIHHFDEVKNNYGSSISTFTVNSNNAARHVYFFLDYDGYYKVFDNEPNLHTTLVKFHVKDAPANGTLNTSNYSSSDAHGLVSLVKGDGTAYLTPYTVGVGVSDGTTLTLYTNAKFQTNTTATFIVDNVGGELDLYLYNDLDGQYKISTEPWKTNSKLTVNFLENVAGDLIAVGPGQYYAGGSLIDANNPDANYIFSGNTYGKNASLSFKYLQDMKFYIDGNLMVLENDGGDRTTTYYNGQFYGNAADAQAQYALDHSGQASPNDFGGPDPDSDKNAIMFVVDVPAGTDFRKIYFQISNVTVKAYEAKSGIELKTQNNDNHFDISSFVDSDTRYIIKITDIPSWVNSNNPVTLNFGLRKGSWNNDGQQIELTNQAYTGDNLGSVNMYKANS